MWNAKNYDNTYIKKTFQRQRYMKANVARQKNAGNKKREWRTLKMNLNYN